MNGNKTLFVTCIYSDLYYSKIGGRLGRQSHYLRSMETLVNMNTDFVIYTSEYDRQAIINSHFYKNNTDRIRVLLCDLYAHPLHSFFQRKLNGITSDRCYEIMHNKVLWIENHLTDGYDNIYWIDAGLSHAGLFPIKHRGSNDEINYYNCDLFTPRMIDNLLKINDKIVILCGNQLEHIFEAPPNNVFFPNNNRSGALHIIGGMFGGKTELIRDLCNKYKSLLTEMVDYDVLEREEQLLTVLYERYPELFYPMIFTTWHHEDSDMAIYNHEGERYFYEVFEELNK